MTTRILPLLHFKPLPELQLEPQALQRLPSLRPGDLLTCTRGVLWVTQAGDPADYLLRAGEAFVANRGAVVVQALAAASYRLSH